MKTHETAVVAIPPESVWEPIQRIRRVHDRKVGRWMPHVTLLYPFYPRSEFGEARPRLFRACARFRPIEVTLATFRTFAHGGGRLTAYLSPEPREPFVALEAALVEEFPDCDELVRRRGGFTPHLSVGQFAGRSASSTIAALEAGWEPLRFELSALALISRAGDAPFCVDEWIPLGREGA